MKIVIVVIFILLILHFVLYFFNIDIFECFEKGNFIKLEKGFIHQDENKEICGNIDSLTKSLEQLKEISQ